MFKKLFGQKTMAKENGAIVAVSEEVENGKEYTSIISPMEGKIFPLSAVPDEIFSEKIMGDGFAIEPSNGEIVAPLSGTIVSLFPTKHAIAMVGEDGTEVLIHVGIDTVKLKGEGFISLVEQGDTVEAGQPLLNVDLEFAGANALSLISPVIFTNLQADESVLIKAADTVKLGQADIIG